jgi:AraC-like DNA-binding protein
VTLTTNNSARIVEFSTENLPERDRAAYWMEHYGHIMLRVDLEPAKDASFEACMTSLALPGLQMIEGSSSPAKISRTGAYLADGNDDVLLAINRAGSVIVSSGRREESLQENQAILLTGNEPTSFHSTSRGQSFTLRVPRPMLASALVDTDEAVMRVIPRERGALRLLSEYTRLLFENGVAMESQLMNLSVTHVQDLLALTIGPTADFKETARTRGLRAARLKLAKTYIIEHSHRRDLSVGSVAAHLSVTPRYVQRMFETDGTTFSEFLVGQRLARAHRLLCEPGFSHTAISTIAYDTGFGDLSYFNRRFRRLYGLTPRDVRGDRS